MLKITQLVLYRARILSTRHCKHSEMGPLKSAKRKSSANTQTHKGLSEAGIQIHKVREFWFHFSPHTLENVQSNKGTLSNWSVAQNAKPSFT